jgi:hypothetical protein
VFLFLNYINKVEIQVEDKRRVIEWMIKQEDKYKSIDVFRILLSEDENPSKKFLLFKKEEIVDPRIREDPLTRDAKREDVERREISIAIALDKNDSPLPLEEAPFWGIYSFMPLPESMSGLKFLLQADFIVQPGKRSINYEASWNKWLMESAAEFVKSVADYLREKYPSSYLPVFGYKEVGGPLYEQLLKYTVVKALEEIPPLVPCINRHWIEVLKAVRFDEGVKQLIEERELDEEDLKTIFHQEDLHLIDHSIKLREQDERKVKRLRIKDLFQKDFITLKGLGFLIKLYEKAGTEVPEENRWVFTRS